MNRPHIIYVLSDEHRGQAMSHAGDPNLKTPAMDRLAAGGASFRRAYANCPVCTPSRGTIFSGRHAHAGPVSGFYDVYKPAAPSIATELRRQGYRTAYFGKWHCGIIYDQVPPGVKSSELTFSGKPTRTVEAMRGGFQDWHGFEYNDAPFRTFVYHDDDLEPTRHAGYQTDVLTDLALEYMAQHDPSDPLFLTLSVEPPHFPCHAPESFRRFDPDSLETRPNFARLDPFFAEFEPELDEQTLRQILANYYAMVENLDWNIDRLTGRLAKLPGFENTLLVYISDHGDYVGCHGLGTTKINHHEESVRIPAIFHWPGEIPSRGQISGLFSLVDLLPTTLGLVNIPLPNWCQGTDFSPLLRGEPFTGPQEVLLEMVNAPRFKPRFQDWRGLVTERWKYAFYEDGRECLFDLETDPYELQDLASSTPEVRIQLRTRLLEMLDETREPFFDVIIEHGVVPPASNYIKDFEGWKNVVRRLGGLEPPDVDP